MPAGRTVLPGPKEGAAEATEAATEGGGATTEGVIEGVTSFGNDVGLMLKFFCIDAPYIGGFFDGTELNLWKF